MADQSEAALQALAAIKKSLVRARIEISSHPEAESTHNHLALRDIPEGEPPHPLGVRHGLSIGAAIVQRRRDGCEVTWSCEAWRPAGQSDWHVEREVTVNDSPIGEPNIVSSTELPLETFASTNEMLRRLPGLVDEVLHQREPEVTQA